MEIKDLTAILVVAMVGCILVAGFIPVVNESVTATNDFENNGYFHMEKYGTDTDITIVWNPDDPKKITVNNVEYVPNTPVNQFVNVAIGDDWYFRYADGGANTYVQVSYGGVDLIAGSNVDGVSVTLTCSNGTATITKSSTTQTMTYTELYVISGDSGAYVMKNANEPVTVAGNTEFIGLGVTPLGTGRAVLKVTGDVDNGATVDVIGSIPSEATISNVNVSAISMVGHNGYSLSNVTFTVTMDAVDYPATYNYFIVPATVTLEKTIHADDNTASIISMIPFILIMGIVLMFVGVVLVRRYV